MKSNNNKSHSSKLNIILVIAALLALIVTVVTISYSWIETSNSLTIQNGAGKTISANVSNPGAAAIDLLKTSDVKLSQYIDNIDSLFLAPARLDGTTLQIKRADGTYSAVTTNDIGNNYIEFDVPFTVDQLYKFSFSADSAITVTGENNPIKVSLSLDGSTANVFDAATIAGKTAFYASAGTTHNLKVRIWLDATTEENATALEGQTIPINLTLVPSTDIGKHNVKLAESPYAIVTATYTDSEGHQQTMNEGDTVAVLPNTKFKLTAVTANGKLITSGSNMVLNGHQFASYSVGSGVMSATSSPSSKTDITKITNATYTVGDSDATIETNTLPDTFVLGGQNVVKSDGSVLSDWKDSITLQYNEDLNCVYAIIQKNSKDISFKIVSGSSFAESDRNNKDLSVAYSLTSSDIINTGNIDGVISNTSNPYDQIHNAFSFNTPVDTNVMIIYYLDSNEVEMTTDTVLKTHYTATANVSTANQHGSATVTYGDTTASSVSVPRRAADKNVTFTATPSGSDYQFVGWSTTDGGTSYVSTDAEYKRTLTGDLTLYANFKRVYTLTVMPLKNTETSATLISAQATLNSTTTDVSFTVDSEPSNTGTASIVEGTTVNLTATAPVATNTYKVVWLDGPTTVKTDTIGAGQSSTSSYSIPNMSAAHNISVQYTQLYRLEVTKTGDGATDSNATVSAEIKDTANNTYELTNGVAYVPAGTTVTVTANVAKGGNPYRVSSEQIGITGKFDLIPTADTAASKTFTQLTINANTTISINFERLYKLTYGLGESVQVATIAAAAKESGAEDFSQLTSSPAYLPKNTEVKFTVNPSGENYTQLYKINSATQYTYGAVPNQTITADMDVEVRVIQNQTVTITVPNPDVATLTAKYTFPDAPEQALNITNTEGNREFKVPQGATVTVKTTIKDSKDKFNGYTVSGSTSYTVDTDNKSVDVLVQDSDITIAPNIAIMDVAECPQEILNGSKIAFYGGVTSSWDSGDFATQGLYLKKKVNTTYSVVVETPISNCFDFTVDTVTYHTTNYTSVDPSLTYYLSNRNASGWEGKAIGNNGTVSPGAFYGLNDTVKTLNATTATTTLSASEVELNAQGVTVTTGSFSSDTTAIGTQFYVQHFIKKSTDTDYTFLGTSQKITATDNIFVTDISYYANTAGTYEIKTVLTDGKVYYLVGDTKTLNVVEKFDVKVYSATNADLEVKNGSTPLGTISAGADAKTFRVAKGDSISVTATPTPNVGGVYDFTWYVNDAEFSNDNKKAVSTLPLDNITGNKEVKVTLGTHYYKLTYSGVTATPDDTYIPANTKVTLTFADSTNHNKVVWKVNGVDEKTSDVVEKGSQDTYEVTMDADKTVSVTKTTLYKLTYSITGADSSTLTSDLSTASADTATVGGSEITKYVTTDVGSVNFTTHRPSGDGFYSVGWAINSAPATYTNSFNSATQTYKDIYQGEADMPITISGDTTVNVTVTKLATTTVTINPESENSVYLTANVSHQDIGAAYDLFTNVTSTDGTYTVPQGTVVTVTSSENAGTGYQPNGFDVTGVTPTSSSVTQVVFTAGSDAIAVTAKAQKATRTIYFKNNQNWSTVNAYAWGDNGKNKDWPGKTMTDLGNGIWSIELTDDTWVNIIFNDGSNQTDDLVIHKNGNDLFTITGSITKNEKKYLTGDWSKYSEITEYNVTVSPVDNAQVEVTYGSSTKITDGNSGPVAENLDLNITLTIDSGYEFKSLSINGNTVSPQVNGNTVTYTHKVTGITTIKAEVKKAGRTIYLKNDANWSGTPSVHIWSSSGNGDYKSWKDAAEKMTYDDSAQLWTYTLTAEDAEKYDRCQFHVNGSKTTQNLVFQAGYIYNNAALFTWSPKDSSVPNTREITVKMTNDVANADINGKPVYYLFSKDDSNVYSVAISKSYDSSNTYTFIIPADCTTFTIQRKDPRNLTGDAWNSHDISTKDVPTDKTTYEITGTAGQSGWFTGSWK